MRSFQYIAPSSVNEVVALLTEKRARPLAGGTDLLVQLRRGLIELELVADVKRIPELNRISWDPEEGLIVGAAVSCASLCVHSDLQREYPGLVDAASIIGGSAIQSRATFGGNLCNAAPSGDSIPAMIVLKADCTIAGREGTRSVPVEEFCVGPGETVLKKGEMLTSIHFPSPSPGSGACYLRFTPRREMDIAVAGAGAWILLDRDRNKILDARIAIGAVAPIPLLVQQAGRNLVGKELNEEADAQAVFAEAAKIAQDAARPITDLRGTKLQRRHLVGVLVKRVLSEAVRRAKAEQGAPSE